MDPSCCTEMKTSVFHHSWTIKNFSGIRANMMLRSTVFSGKSTNSSAPVSWYYELDPKKTISGQYYVAIEAFTDSTYVPDSRLHADIVVECNNGNVTNPTCSGPIQSAACIGCMNISRTSVTSYLLNDGALTLRFKFTLHEEIRNGVPPQRLDFSPDALLLDHLKELFSSMKFSDVTFAVGKKQFPAHKAVLSVRSPVFAAMFEHEMQESKANQVKIVDIQSDVFREVLRFVYTGSVPEMELMATDLLIAADKYVLDTLKKMCEDQLAMKLTVETATTTLRVADTYNANQLKKATINFISKHLKEMKSCNWKRIIESHPQVAADMIAEMAMEH